MTRLKIVKGIGFDLSTADENTVSVTKRNDGKVDIAIHLAPPVASQVFLKGLEAQPAEIVVGLETIETQNSDGTVAKKLKISLKPDNAIARPDCCVECDGRIVCGPNACVTCNDGTVICCEG